MFAHVFLLIMIQLMACGVCLQLTAQSCVANYDLDFLVKKLTCVYTGKDAYVFDGVKSLASVEQLQFDRFHPDSLLFIKNPGMLEKVVIVDADYSTCGSIFHLAKEIVYVNGVGCGEYDRPTAKTTIDMMPSTMAKMSTRMSIRMAAVPLTEMVPLTETTKIQQTATMNEWMYASISLMIVVLIITIFCCIRCRGKWCKNQDKKRNQEIEQNQEIETLSSNIMFERSAVIPMEDYTCKSD